MRIDFIVFTGFDLSETPDYSTINRFRNRLIKFNKLEILLEEINRQLKEQKLMVSKTKGALLDASLITSAARPRTEAFIEIPEGEEEAEAEAVIHKKLSADPEARWVKKGKKSYFGYRGYAVVDAEGYLLGSHTASANESEQKHFADAIEVSKINHIYFIYRV